MANWYVSSAGYTAVSQWVANHAYTSGQIVRQLTAPSLGSERCFRCTTPGTSGGAEPGWSLTKSSTTTDNTVTWTECTGQESFQTTNWAAPFARLATALGSGFSTAGDNFFVSSDHAETQASTMTLTPQATLSSPSKIVCATRPSSAIPPVAADLATTATVSTTGASNLSIASTAGGFLYVDGITFSAGDAANTASLNIQTMATNKGSCIFENCGLKLGNTSASSLIQCGSTGGTGSGPLIWKNCTVTLGAAAQFIAFGSLPFIWNGGSLAGTAPTTLFTGWTANIPVSYIEVRNVDLSLIGAAQSLITQPSGITHYAFKVNFTNCLLNASLGSVMSGTIDYPGHCEIDLDTSDNATTSREEHYRYSGSVIADQANYLTAGATNGTNHKSWKFSTNANASYIYPLFGSDIFQWVTTTGSHTITMFLSNTSATSFKDNEVGFDIEYLGQTSGNPRGSLDTTFSNALAPGTALPSDTQPWTGQGGLTKQKITKTVTINEPGFIRITPRIAKASATLWLDPLPVVL